MLNIKGTEKGTRGIDVSLKWLSDRWTPEWADSPNEVPEWDFSRVGDVAYIWASRKRNNPKARWSDFRDSQCVSVQPPPSNKPEDAPKNYPRLVMATRQEFEPGTYITESDPSLPSVFANSYAEICADDALEVGSAGRALILELATKYSPFAHQGIGSSDLSYRSWATAVSRVYGVLKVVSVLEKLLSVDEPTVSNVLEFTAQELKLERPVVKRMLTRRTWPPTEWHRIQGQIKDCSSPRQIRLKLALYLQRNFNGPGIRYGPFGDGLALSAHRGTGDWTYFLAAQQVQQGETRQCEADGCPKFLPSGSRADKKTCSETCKKRLQRKRELENPVTNL